MKTRTPNGTQNAEHLAAKHEPAKTGDEYDLVTGWRKVTNNNWKRIKKRMIRRNRRRAKRILRQLRKDDTP